MKMNHLSTLGIAAALFAASAQAAPVVFFGENQAPAQIATGTPATARASFLGNLTGVGVETFEGQTTGAAAPLALTFPGSAGNITATLSGTGVVFQTPSAAGRFNTTGASAAPVAGKWWQVEGTFEIAFSSAISAFGFYGTDIGDFNGQVTIALTDTDNITTVLNSGNTINAANGSLMFWGIVDTVKSYTKVTFGNTSQNGSDFFGFDDMVIGDRQQIRPPNGVPEPGILALLALGLVGAGTMGRRRQA